MKTPHLAASPLLLLLCAAFLPACKRPATPATAPPVSIEQGTGWRGDGTGHFPGATPPLSWSPNENIRWRTPLPSWSNASPVLAGDRIFVCAEPSTLLCLDANTGHILWQRANSYLDLLPPEQAAQAQAALDASAGTRRELQKAQQALRRAKATAVPANLLELEAGVADLQRQLGSVLPYELPPTEARLNGYTTPTPVTDGRRVIALFGNGVAAAYDLEGTRLWARVVEKPTDEFGQSASPLLADGKLLIHIDRLHALDPETGRTLWQATTAHGWGTPIIATVGAEPGILTTRGDYIHLRDGRVLTTKCPRLDYNSPLWDPATSTAWFLEGKAHALTFLPGKSADKLDRTSLWDITLPGDRYYASPILHGGLLFAVNSRGDLSVIDPARGTLLAQRQLPAAKEATFYSSLVLAGGTLFATSDDGTTYLLSPDRDLRPLGVNLIAPLRSNLLFAGPRLYARTLEALVCISVAVDR